ncbi:hypothetical protein Btru_059054 [Bulinus truncatus]|nr:hypothetical protein Btru_059054 [Bulinus truncatus]
MIKLLLLFHIIWFVYSRSIEYACVSSDGLHMQAGNGYVPSKCTYCTCQNSGDITCVTIQCSPISGSCDKYEVPPGGCCPVCVDDVRFIFYDTFKTKS